MSHHRFDGNTFRAQFSIVVPLKRLPWPPRSTCSTICKVPVNVVPLPCRLAVRTGKPSRSCPITNAPAPRPSFGNRWNAYLAIALGLILSVGLVGASALLARRNDQALQRVSRTENARAALATVLKDLDNAETGQRGFLLTDKDAYLIPYRSGIEELPSALDTLQTALSDSPVSLAMMPDLRRLAADKLDELKTTLDQAMAGNRAAALDLVQSDRGQRDMTAIRAIVDQLYQQQQAMLADQIAAVNEGGRMLVIADALGFVMLALLAAAIAWGGWQAFRSLRAAQAELAAAYQALSLSNETLEDRVRERTAALSEANEEIQRFAYIVSHDLRAPLVNIMGFTSEMEGAAATVRAFAARAAEADPAGTQALVEAAEEDIPESIRFIKTSTAKMDRLIGAILKLSREGRRVLTPEVVAMNPLLEGIAASLRHQSEERGATVTIAALPDIPTDRLVLEQVFSNLLENALKYLQPGRPGRIEVTGRRIGRSVLYEVKDNGRGIAARDLERVFELFRRAGDQTVPGEGIGLAHVRALVRRLGGRIDCVSAEGVGSTFRVELPISGMPAAELAGSEPQPADRDPAEFQEQERVGP
jgi:signal transduction histidine kinase